MITVLTGENSFLLNRELRRLVDGFVAEHGDMALEQFDGEETEFDRMREALQSLPFLASKKLVVLKKPSANKQFVETAEALLSDVSDTTDVIVVEPKLDKRLSYYKFLKKSTNFTEFNELDAAGLARWLVATAKERSGSLTQQDAAYLVDRIGVNQQQLSSELDKLLSYSQEISRDTIDAMTVRNPQSTTFDLLDAALGGKGERALALYEEQRAMNVEPQLIMGTFGWQLHVMALIKTAGNRDPQTIAKEAKLNPFVVRKSQALANRLSLAELKELIHRVATLDRRLKSEAIDPDEAFRNLIISLK